MQRLAFMFFAVAVIVSTAFVIATGQDLPVRVASHFGLRGAADSFLSRDAYVLIFALLTSVVPIVSVAVKTVVARLRPGGACKRHREFWSSPENRDTAITYCTTRSLIIGGMLSLFLAGMHYTVLRANEVQPPRLPYPDFPLLTGLFLIAVAVVSLMFRVQMDRVARGSSR